MPEEHKIDGYEYTVLQARTEDGVRRISKIRLDGKEIEVDEPTQESNLKAQIISSLLDELNGPLFSSRLTDYVGNISTDTNRFKTLEYVVENYPVTSSDIKDDIDESHAAALPSLKDDGYICHIDTDDSSYLYVPTHVGIAEVYHGVGIDEDSGLNLLFDDVKDSEESAES